MSSTRLLALQFTLLVCLAVILIPAGAHLFEYPSKMGLEPAEYMVTQRIYAGWAWFGLAIYAAMTLLAFHALALRKHRLPMVLSLVALAVIVLTQAIFWRYTFPMNALTRNWTVSPPDVAAARWQWETSHALNAILTFLAFILGTLSVLTGRRS